MLHYPLSKIRQPRVIAEIIGGILLGPSVFGRISGFTDAIFPKDSMPTLSLAANVGLVLFLFLVGLEVDLRIMVSNWKIALSVGAAGMTLPFGLGCAIAYGLYHQFRLDSELVPISFGTYMLFVGVAMSITAFPVLCRILTELSLLQNKVGVIVLSAGVGNDVTGWILLALCVALVNAGSGITALYVLLVAVGYVIFLVYLVRPLFLSILKRTGSLHNGPSQSVVALTLLMTFASAFFTGIIGIHPIFGAFLIGLICPHEGGFAIKLTEKIEDIVSVFFLPLYFALSGLSTNIGLLDSGITWAYVIGVIAVAFIGKVVGGTIAARLCKLVWRESLTVGVLMSCKGLVELIVLNIGLQAKILSQRTFTIFVIMALATTFATTPLTSALYPPWYQKKLAAWQRGEIDWDGNTLISEDHHDATTREKQDINEVRKVLVYLRLDSLPSLYSFLSLFTGEKAGPKRKITHPRIANNAESTPLLPKPLEVHGLRMFELTDRLSSAMRDSEVDDFSTRDPVVNAFRTFGQLNHMAVSGDVQVVPETAYAETVNSSAASMGSDLVLLHWSETGGIGEAANSTYLDLTSDSFGSVAQNQFVQQFLGKAPCHAAILVDDHFKGQKEERPRSIRRANTALSARSVHDHQPCSVFPLTDNIHHIFFPFIGGADDHFALAFLLQLARNPNVTATIVFVHRSEAGNGSSASAIEPQDIKGEVNVVTSPVTQESIDKDQALLISLRDSLPDELKDRVIFEDTDSLRLADLAEYARSDLAQGTNNASNICVVGRNHCRGSLELSDAGVPEIRHTLGGLAAGLLGEVDASMLVVQVFGQGHAIKEIIL